MLTAKIITRQPGRPSGVADAGSSTSIAASQPQPITEVAKPVIETAACRAHLRFGAVMTIAVARMPKASANVSSIATPLTSRLRHGTSPNGCSRAIAASGKVNQSSDRP